MKERRRVNVAHNHSFTHHKECVLVCRVWCSMETLTDDLMQQFLQFLCCVLHIERTREKQEQRRERERENRKNSDMVKTMIMLFKMMIVAAPLSGSDICSQHPPL